MSDVNWNEMYSRLAAEMKPSPIREMRKYTIKPGMISFAGGNPDPYIFPVPEFAAGAIVLGRNGMEIMQYGATEGYAPLREFISKWMAPRMGRETSMDEILITTGSQQGMDLLTAALINPGDAVIVEDPTYPGAIHTMRNRGAAFITVPCDSDGINTDLLPEAIETATGAGARIKFIYSIVNFQNPTGGTLSTERRKKLLEIAERYDLIIFEDDPYGHLRYEGEHEPTLFSMDKGGRVVYACSFSKILAPGTRVAWIVGAPEIIRRMVMIKQGTDMCTSVIAQALVTQYCTDGYLESFLPKIVSHYSVKCRAMMDAFAKHLPSDAQYTPPKGGFFFWVRIPGIDSQQLFMKGIEKGVAFVNGPAFYANGGGTDCLRTCFTYAQPSELEEGARRLAEAIEDLRAGR
ncbi:MAG: PLP-dependent aminotransferase family protein [Synergistaceae bacterium]|jgi:2-aminoadipate transaminase|nr:PLP-dependent aminotransferase family protein [Synergistaceae bacterium]